MNHLDMPRLGWRFMRVRGVFPRRFHKYRPRLRLAAREIKWESLW